MARTFFHLASVLFLALAGICLGPYVRAAEDPMNAAAARVDPTAVPVDELTYQQAPRERVSFAVVVGNNRSLGSRRPDLHYADDDAARYFEILQTIAPGRVALLAAFDRDTERLFPEAHRQTVPPKRGTLQTVGQQLAEQVQAANRAGHETEVYFVFAGHGDVAQGEGFIELADSRFRSSELQSWLRNIPFTRAHVILDSCNSFFMLGVRKPGGRRFATSEDAARSLASQLPNVGVFLSTSAEGEAFEWSEIQSGIFSHLVRSGLMGGADTDADGTVSYLELAAFVDTATTEVRNPNMRPHVYARGPGASDETPIARLSSMTSVRRFTLGDTNTLRVRVRDVDGLPLFDAHAEHARDLQIAMPEAWARGAVVERTRQQSVPPQPKVNVRSFYAVPEAPETVTLATLQEINPSSSVRGPDETFQTLFAQPFGPQAYGSYVARRNSGPPPVYGVSKEDVARMQLVLDEIARVGRGKRLTEGLGGLSFGALMVGAGIGVLHFDPSWSRREKSEARWLGGGLVGLGGLLVIGASGALAVRSPGEEAAVAFRRAIHSGIEPTQAFVAADTTVRQLAFERQQERWAGAIIGSLLILGCGTGLVWGEFTQRNPDYRMARRLGWGGGMVRGAIMLGDAVLTETPADTLTRIWRDDPTLNQYQAAPSVGISRDGAFVSLTGSW